MTGFTVTQITEQTVSGAVSAVIKIKPSSTDIDIAAYNQSGAAAFNVDTFTESSGLVHALVYGSGATIDIDYAKIVVYDGTSVTILSDGSDIQAGDNVNLNYIGSENEIAVQDNVIINGLGARNNIDFWGHTETISMNYFQIPYQSNDSIYDTAEDILNGVNYLVFNDFKNPRAPTQGLVIENPPATQSVTTVGTPDLAVHSWA